MTAGRDAVGSGKAIEDARAEVVALHRKIYRRQRREIDASVHGYTGGFRAYEGAYQRRVRSYRSVIDYEEVVQRASDVDLIYVGDYHTLKQSQKAFAKLVERVLGHGRPVALALEFVLSDRQRAVDAWLGGRLSERSLLSRIGYPEHHVFPIWQNFRPVFELARDLALPVLAVDLADASLVKRDEHAAEIIAAYRAEHPDTQVLVLTGQLHVPPTHLPRAVARASRRLGLPTPSHLIVYQNCEEIYWRLTAEGLEHSVLAVDVGDHEVCLINTSPMVAQQSYLNHLHDDDVLDESLETAPERTFKQMCRALCKFLEADIGKALEDVSVYSLGDLSFLRDLKRSKRFTDRELQFMERQILASESYYIPRAGLVYLGNLSVNHAAEEAAHFIRHVMTEDDGDRDGLVDAFYARVINEGLAFFGSKVINPRRKCHHPPQLQALVDAWTSGQRTGLHETEIKAARMVLAHLRLERGERMRGLRNIYGEPDPDLFNLATHLLGYILGDRLYYGMIQGRTSKAEMRQLFLDPLDEAGDAFHAYFYLASKVRRVRIPRRP